MLKHLRESFLAYTQVQVFPSHRNLKIHDNVFRVFDPRILNLYCVDGVDFQNNTIEMTNDYIYNRQETRRFVYENCDGVRIEE